MDISIISVFSIRPRPLRWNCGGIKRDKSAKHEFIRSRRRFSMIRCESGSCCRMKKSDFIHYSEEKQNKQILIHIHNGWTPTRDGLLRLPGGKSSSSLYAAFAAKFKPFSPQYEYPTESLKSNKQTKFSISILIHSFTYFVYIFRNVMYDGIFWMPDARPKHEQNEQSINNTAI